MKVRIIYLASGNSRRFGSNKLLYQLDGKEMYLHLLERLMRIVRRHSEWKMVVVTQYPEIVSRLETYPVKTIHCPDSVKGISWSIRAGMQNLSEEEACAFFVADQPYLTEHTAEGFLCRMEKEESELGCVFHNGHPGNPTWFGKKYFSVLQALSGDMGGRKIFQEHKGEETRYIVETRKELKDFDYRSEMFAFRNKSK